MNSRNLGVKIPISKKWQCLYNEHEAGRQTVRQDAWRHERGYAGGWG